MMQGGAFGGNATLRATALAAMDDLDTPAALSMANPHTRNAFADNFQLPRAYVNLVAALGGTQPLDGTASFQLRALTALTAGTDADAIVRSWLTWLHQAPQPGLEAALAGTPAAAAAIRILDLHRRSAEGGTQKAEWREGRRTLNESARSLPTEAHACAAVMAAMAWDTATTPGIGTDIMIACDVLLQCRSDRAIGWTEGHATNFQRLQMEYIEQAAGAFGFSPGDVPLKRHREVRDRFQQLWDDAGHQSLSDMFERRNSALGAARETFRQAAREAFLAVTSDIDGFQLA